MQLHSAIAVVTILVAALILIRALPARRIYQWAGIAVPGVRHLA